MAAQFDKTETRRPGNDRYNSKRVSDHTLPHGFAASFSSAKVDTWLSNGALCQLGQLGVENGVYDTEPRSRFAETMSILQVLFGVSPQSRRVRDPYGTIANLNPTRVHKALNCAVDLLAGCVRHDSEIFL